MVVASSERVSVGEQQRPAVFFALVDQPFNFGVIPDVESQVVQSWRASVVSPARLCPRLLHYQVGGAKPPTASCRPLLVPCVAEAFQQPPEGVDSPIEIRNPQLDMVQGSGDWKLHGGNVTWPASALLRFSD